MRIINMSPFIVPIKQKRHTNHIWHENEKQKGYLFLGESNISWYVYQYKNQCYMELDQPSGREIHRFRNFYEMCDKVLSEAIMG